MILKNILNEEMNLVESSLFKKHLETKGSYAEFLVEQLNNDELFQKFLKGKKDLNIIDIGGNVGLWTLYFAPICENIIAVEPTLSHCQIAIDLFNLFDKRRNIVLLNAAISDIDGEKNFFTGEINSTMNSFYAHRDHNQMIQVKTHKLKTIIKNLNKKIDFIKLDAEGSEQQIIMDNDFDSFIYDNVENIYIEVHDTLGANYNEIYEKLKSLNYKIEKIGQHNLYASK